MYRFATAVLIAVVAPSAHAQTKTAQPHTGYLTGIRDKDFLEYECGDAVGETMTCKFNQITIRRKGKPEDLAKQLADVPKLVEEAKKAKREDYDTLKKVAEAFRTGVPLPAVKGKFPDIASLSPTERADSEKSARLMAEFCEAPSVTGLEALIRSSHDMTMRSCAVMGNSYEQTFVKTGPNWVHSKGPEGICGRIYITRFEPDPDDAFCQFWHHFSRKVITNKGDNGSLGAMQCRDQDEQEYKYVWRQSTVYKGCDYFSYFF